MYTKHITGKLRISVSRDLNLYYMGPKKSTMMFALLSKWSLYKRTKSFHPSTKSCLRDFGVIDPSFKYRWWINNTYEPFKCNEEKYEIKRVDIFSFSL